jgi:flavin reductase (DIM6/NTAB) family NADH-FMN oxidoreductase RutF
MLTINPKDISVPAMHGYLLGAVTPRPIALASTIDAAGNVNLSPFSFFNCFGSNPPFLIFSPARRVRDNTDKHTYQNVLEVPEVVIHIVSYDMVHQTSLASTEYRKGIDEFIKAGFTAEPSLMVTPPRVREAPIAMECKVRQVISTGEEGGAGNLIMCEVVLMHIHENVLGEDGKIDPVKLDVVARLGGDWYARISADSLFKVPKPVDKTGIGIDNLPYEIRNSKILSGNDLGQLANVEAVPALELDHPVFHEFDVKGLNDSDTVFKTAKGLLSLGKIAEAWQLLLYKTKNPA